MPKRNQRGHTILHETHFLCFPIIGLHTRSYVCMIH